MMLQVAATEVENVMAKSAGGDRHPQACIAGMVLLRLFLGGYFLYEGFVHFAVRANIAKFLRTATGDNGLYLTGSAWTGFQSFLQHTVHRYVDAITLLLILLSLLGGVLLLVGLLTRLGALLTMAVTLFSLFCVWNLPPSGENFYPPFLCYVLFLVMELAVLIAAAGRTWGVDAILARRTKFKPLW